MGRRVVINQSDYLPWKGYFDLIHDADLFIFLDDVQFTHRDWRSRNRIKTPHGLHWLTVPVGGATDRLINEVPLPMCDWTVKHWALLRHAYSACPFFVQYAPFFADVFARPRWATLSALNQFLIKTIARDFLQIQTEFADSSTYKVEAVKQERILGLLKAAGGTTYISGPAARSYLDPARFEKEGIELIWKDYSGYPEYKQPHPPFEHAVSIVDLLFSTGPNAPEYIWGWRIQSSP